MNQNMSKPMFTFQAIWSVRCHTLLLSSPTLSNGLFVILAFRPSSALIDAPDYSGICPRRILALSQHHILCKPPHPLPRLQAPASLLIMGNIKPQLLILTQTTMTNPNRQVSRSKTLPSGPNSTKSTSLSSGQRTCLPILIDVNNPSPISAMALHLNHVQSHLPTLRVAPFLAPLKGPCHLSRQRQIIFFPQWELHRATSQDPQIYCHPVAQEALKHDCLSLP